MDRSRAASVFVINQLKTLSGDTQEEGKGGCSVILAIRNQKVEAGLRIEIQAPDYDVSGKNLLLVVRDEAEAQAQTDCVEPR